MGDAKRRKELREAYRFELERVAERWFDGDQEHAERVFYELPYSDIPGIHHLNRVMAAIYITPGHPQWGEDYP